MPELDSSLVMKSCFEVISEAAANSPEKVSALGISSQGEAFTALDSNGNYLCNAMVSSDSRAAAISSEWPEQFGIEKLYNITGHAPHPMFTLFKLIWLKKKHPHLWDKTAKICCFEDLLQYKLGVREPVMTYSLAGRTMLFDVKNHCWNTEILDKIGLDKSKLSRPLPPGTVSGKVNRKTAEQLGLAADTIVVTGGHDQTCAALGAGVIAPGKAMLASGTVECICPAIEKAVFSENMFKNNLCTYDYALPEVFTTVAFSLTGGNIFKWFRDNFGQPEVAEAAKTNSNVYKIMLDTLPEKPTKLHVLPYFTPTGTPYFDLDTPGAILGLRLSTSRNEMLKALLEGVAMEMRLNLDVLQHSGIPVNSLTAVGGGAKSRKLIQLKADVLNTPINCVDEPEAGCKGVALLAAAAKLQSRPQKLATEWIKIQSTIIPRREHTMEYADKFEYYKNLYYSIKNFYNQF